MSGVVDSGRKSGHGNIDATRCGHRLSKPAGCDDLRYDFARRRDVHSCVLVVTLMTHSAE
jgi:hypothetical protein